MRSSKNLLPCKRYWSVFIEYEDIVLDHEEKTKKRKLPELNKSQKLLLDKLFETRRELADIVLKMSVTFEQLKNIHGFGSNKDKKNTRKIFGSDFIH